MQVISAEIESKIVSLIQKTTQEWDEDCNESLTLHTKLIQNLGFASVDFVQLVVDIEEAFSQKLGFQDLLMKNGKYIDDLSIGELVEFVDRRLSLKTQPPTPNLQPPTPSPQLLRVSDSERITGAKVAQFRRLIPPRQARTEVATQRNKPAVFILSPPRSGSTLLRVILAGHPRLFAPPELHLLLYNTLAQRKSALSGPSTDYLLEGTVRAIMQLQHCSAETAQAAMERWEAKLTTQEFYGLMQQWLGDRLLVDKTPSYAMFPEILERAETDFQNPFFIHLVRHPYGSIRSYEDSKLERIVLPFVSDVNENLFSGRELAELTWLVSQQNILNFLRRVPQNRQLRVSFEALVSQPQATIQGICEFLHLDFHPAMLQPYDDKAQRMTDGVQTVARMGGDLKFHLHSGIDADAADKWKQFQQVDFLGDLTWEVAANLGYSRDA